ncbi:hypothetical protein ACFYQ5_06360 [Streptomyces sp. NPDC005794]|uniref:hypothetical protein n=1 Tax=Streptomyces sp. NPDC005794 TaxID=3364733 RepID=UPI0036D16358
MSPTAYATVTLHLLGGANWWLPARLDRLLPRISIEPPDRTAPRAKIPRERTDDAVRTVAQRVH